jgi:DNA polymerase III epsilon subunit-like protein
MAGPGFAVLDFETTGLFPGGHDRVVEVAVVHVDDVGRVTGQWETLVNPQRDLGAQHIHGIRSADILEAPTFAAIAPHLVDLLGGRVLVAHNASFDVRFLLAGRADWLWRGACPGDRAPVHHAAGTRLHSGRRALAGRLLRGVRHRA